MYLARNKLPRLAGVFSSGSGFVLQKKSAIKRTQIYLGDYICPRY